MDNVTAQDIHERLLGTWWIVAREGPLGSMQRIQPTERERIVFHRDHTVLDRRYGEATLRWGIRPLENDPEFPHSYLLLLTHSLTEDEIRNTEEFTGRKLQWPEETHYYLIRKIHEDELELQHYDDERGVEYFRRHERAKF